MKVQLCWRKKAHKGLFSIKKQMSVKQAHTIFRNVIDNEDVTLAYMRRWEGYSWICHKVLKQEEAKNEAV